MANETLSIFNIGEHQAEMNAGMFQEKPESELFDPKLKDIKEQKVCIIRMMPYVKDPLHSLCSKSFYAIGDAMGTCIFDSRTTFNNPAEHKYEFCPVSDMWLKLRGSKDANVQNRSKMLRMQRANYAYVQIIKFPGEEALEGQMRVMRLPAELVKLLSSMAKPSEQELALGTQPVQPFDIMRAKNIKCTITGKMVENTLMRDWKVETAGEVCEAQFPLGPNGAMTPVSKLKQEDVIKYFTENQKVDLQERYGYHEPTIDVKRRVKIFLQGLAAGIPGLPEVVAGYFPELIEAAKTDVEAQPLPTAQPTTAVNPIPVGDPMAAPQPQPAPQPEPQPATGGPAPIKLP